MEKSCRFNHLMYYIVESNIYNVLPYDVYHMDDNYDFSKEIVDTLKESYIGTNGFVVTNIIV